MKIETLSKRDKDFMLEYNSKLFSLQKEVNNNKILYTKITLSYAILHNLCIISLLFHPLSIDIRDISENYIMTYNNTLNIFKAIIEYEFQNSQTALTTEELQRTIQHFRYLQTISSYDFAVYLKES
jgi:hypothetical protein